VGSCDDPDIEKLRSLLFAAAVFGNCRLFDLSEDADEDPDALVPAPVRKGPLDRSEAIALPEPEE